MRRLPLTIEGLGPHQSLETEIVDGLNEVRAPNGWGKTWLFRLLVQIGARNLRAGDIEINDELTGAEGRVEFGPAKVVVKPGGKTAREGHQGLSIGGVPEPVALVHHARHIKEDNPEARLRARYEGLGEWTGITGTPEQRVAVLGDDEQLRAWADASADAAKAATLIDLVKAARRRAHKVRQQHEEMLEKQTARLRDGQSRAKEVALETGHDWPPPEGDLPTLADAREWLQLAQQEAAVVRAKRQRYLDEQVERVAIAAALGDPPNVELARAEVEDAGRLLQDAVAGEAAARDRVEELRRRLATAAAELEAQSARSDALRKDAASSIERLRQAEQAYRQHAETRSRLESALEGPTEEQVAAADAEVERCQADLRLAAAADRYSSIMETEREVLEQIEVEQKAIEHWTDQAADIWSRLAAVYNTELVASGGRFRVAADGRIEVRVGESWYDVDDSTRVSEGQLAEACYEEMLSRHKAGDVIVVEGTCSVDPDGLARIGAIAQARGIAVCVETTAPAGDGWRVIHHPGGAA